MYRCIGYFLYIYMLMESGIKGIGKCAGIGDCVQEIMNSNVAHVAVIKVKNGHYRHRF